MTTLPPIRRSIRVSWDPLKVHRFTHEFGTWWPAATHSVGGSRLQQVVFECRLGGLIYEELKDGRRFQWGRVLAWEPPHKVAFTWHPSKDESQAQDVEVTFRADGTGTSVELVSSGWERFGKRARVARRGYELGWRGILDVYAGRSSAAAAIPAVVSTAVTLVLRLTGRLDAEIDRAGGRIAP
jgi:uncharacterized protein YndB with AHSA1/START domain